MQVSGGRIGWVLKVRPAPWVSLLLLAARGL